MAATAASALTADHDPAGPPASPPAAHPTSDPPSITLYTRTAGQWTRANVLYPDQALRLQLKNLTPGQTVTVRADWKGCLSHASFRVGPTGTVDLARQAPSEGTYRAADPDGLLWSMTCPGKGSNAKDSDLHLSAEVGGVPIAGADIPRPKVRPWIRTVEVREKGLVGRLFLPPGKGPFPTVLLLGGSEGGMWATQGSASYLASRGYAVLTLAYFKEKGLPPELKNVPLEYFGRALDYLSHRPEVDANRLAVWGASRGGELSLILGSMYPQLKAVVASVPSGVVWGGDSPTDNHAAAWTLNGKPIPHIKITDDEGEKYRHATPVPGGGVAADYNGSYLAGIADPAKRAAAEIPVEKIHGPVLLLAAGSDRMWPSGPLSRVAWNRLQAHHHPYPDEIHVFPNAGHLIDGTGYPTTFPYEWDPDIKEFIPFGGTPEGSAAAGRQTQRIVNHFLDSLLRPAVS
jgi:dienelactone hydrolase